VNELVELRKQFNEIDFDGRYEYAINRSREALQTSGEIIADSTRAACTFADADADADAGGIYRRSITDYSSVFALMHTIHLFAEPSPPPD
jgi:hypothetical protein